MIYERLFLIHIHSRVEWDDLRFYRPTPHGNAPRKFEKQRNRSETLSSQLFWGFHDILRSFREGKRVCHWRGSNSGPPAYQSSECSQCSDRCFSKTGSLIFFKFWHPVQKNVEILMVGARKVSPLSFCTGERFFWFSKLSNRNFGP